MYRCIIFAIIQHAVFILSQMTFTCEAATDKISLLTKELLEVSDGKKVGNISATTYFARKFSAHCGGRDWKNAYATVHRRARARSVRTNDILAALHHHHRLAVSVAVEAGLADRVIGTLSIFFYALFSDRALQLVTYNELPGFETALSPVDEHVDWRLPGGIDDELIDVLKYTYKGVRGYVGDRSYDRAVIDTSRFWPVYMVNDFDAVDELLGLQWKEPKEGTPHFSDFNMRESPRGHGEAPVVILSSNRGRAFRLFESPQYRQKLFDFGLRPETCIACAFHYLFRPNAQVEELYGDTFRRLADNSILTIGIAVRVGDEVFGSGDEEQEESHLWSIAEPYFDCASQIESTRAQAGQRVLIYLISESRKLRQLAKKRLGEKILTDVSTRYDHPDDVHNRNITVSGPASKKKALDRAMQHAVGQVLAFSMADFHVFTSQSGFGRLGAWLNFGWHHLYAIGGNGERRKCGLADYDLLRDDSAKWAGM